MGIIILLLVIGVGQSIASVPMLLRRPRTTRSSPIPPG
jgi:hypothetical protein